MYCSGRCESLHTNAGPPTVQCSMIAAIDCKAFFLDDVIVGSQHNGNCCKAADFQIYSGNSADSATANNEDCLFGISHCRM